MVSLSTVHIVCKFILIKLSLSIHTNKIKIEKVEIPTLKKKQDEKIYSLDCHLNGNKPQKISYKCLS